MSLNFADKVEKVSKGRINRMKRDMDSEIRKELVKLGQRTAEQLRKYTSYWYTTYTPISYTRTEELISSISYEVVGKRSVRVFFDTRKMNSYITDDGWNVHRGFDGVDFTEGLVEWIENGGSTELKSNPRGNHNGIHMVEKTRQWLDEYLDKEVNKIVNVVIEKYQ